ncbi:TetR/AcrR family transcriptional regulator [Kocuria sp. NPDC057446]|uniref:TetR/AcrR family transcriptional regulator n=1 Tax=Kocuria sp. NPDC057446 TaxID=3346137 RepID=UPI003692C2B7
MRSKAGPGGAPTFTKTARRAQILACAIEAIAETGYGRASLAEIARRAGVSKGVVSYYFTSKDELLTQVVLDVYGRAGAAIAARTDTETDPSAVLTGYVEANLAFLDEHPADIRAVTEIAMNLRTPEGAPRFTPSGADPVLTHLEGLLRAGQEAGSFRDFDAHALAILVRGAIDTASGRLVTDPDFDLSTYTRELVALVGLATRRTP